MVSLQSTGTKWIHQTLDLMSMNPHHHPDLAPVTRHLRAMYSSRLLVAAVHHLNVFELLQGGLVSLADLKNRVGLAERPAMVLFPALCAMGLLRWQTPDQLALTEMGSYLTSSSASNLIGYAALEKNDPGVSDMAQCLLNDGPPEKEGGIGYVKEGDAPSPMDDPEISRFLTLALAGRARVLSPLVAAHLSSPEGHLLDVAGGTGLYTYEFLLRNPQAYGYRNGPAGGAESSGRISGKFLTQWPAWCGNRAGKGAVPARRHADG
jgi:hypothetical protein